MKVALIKDDVVVNVVMGDQGFADAVASEWDAVLVLADTDAIGPGWIVGPNGPEPPPPPPPQVPQSVTMRQGRLALLNIGKLADVDAAINAMPEPQKSQSRIEWEYSNTLDRDNPLVISLGPALGLSPQDIDNLFIEAAKL